MTGNDGRSVLAGWIESGRQVPAFARELVEGVTDHLTELDATLAMQPSVAPLRAIDTITPRSRDFAERSR